MPNIISDPRAYLKSTSKNQRVTYKHQHVIKQTESVNERYFDSPDFIFFIYLFLQYRLTNAIISKFID